MAANDDKDLVYPKVAPQTISAFNADASFSTIRGSKVASLVSAINARAQAQHSPIQVEQTGSSSENCKTGTRTNSYSCHEIQPQTLGDRLQHEVPGRFSSECNEDKLEQNSVMMTRSLGRNEFLRLKPESHEKFRFSGEVISTKSSNASLRTMGPVSRSLKVIPKGKVESNPFFQLDRQRTNLKQILSPVCNNQSNFSTVSDNRRDHLSDSTSIKMRIKLWSEMETEAKQQQVPIERRKSAHFPISCNEAIPLGYHDNTAVSADQTGQRSNSMSSLHVDITKGVDKLLATNILDSKSVSDVTAEIETQRSDSPLNIEDRLHVNVVGTGGVDKGDNISVEVISDTTPPASQKESPKRNVKDSSSGISKGLSKLSTRLLSPRFHRKKVESEHRGDKEPAKRIGGRSSKKRKAFKSKVASTTSNSNCAPDELILSDVNIQSKPVSVDDDDVFASEELSQRASSVSENSRKNVIITKKRAESQPIDPQQLNLTTAQLEQSELAGASLSLCEDTLKGDAAHPKPSHQHPEAEDQTISRDTSEVVNLLGSVSDSEMIFVRMSGSGDSSSDDEPYTTNTRSDGPACPIQSCLDKEVIPSRSTMKRRASENIKSSICTSPEKITRKGSISPYQDSDDGLIATPLMYADAVWDRDAQDSDEISFEIGDVIEILDMSDDVWWQGSVHDTVGWFPASFVRLRIGQESDDDNDEIGSVTSEANKSAEKCPPESSSIQDRLQLHDPEMPSDNSTESIPTIKKLQGNSVRRRMTIRRKDSAPNLPRKLTPTEVRAKVVEEILNTERDYVRNLEDIVEGFLYRCRDYSTLFDGEKVETIFSNVEEIYRFQRDFLRELESKVDRDRMDCSEIGSVFVINKHEFAIYSQYCNNHPHAVNEMNILQQNEQYTLFFESCRLLRNLQDISLEGFLLTPVQKICKYPLQLSELLKYTDEAHPDHDQVVAAQQAMKEVAMQINEQKRRMENVGKIGVWQLSIDNWKGPDILEKSTELIHSGELQKISKGHSQERHFFLFDQQLVYCKKEIGGKLSYKGRLNMEECQIADLPDGTALHGNSPIKYAWRMKNKSKDKWYIIYAKTLETKQEWMDAFRRERTRVLEDHDKGFHISMKMKRAAVSLVESSTEHIKRRKSFSRKHILFTESVDGGVRQRIDSSSSGKKLAVSGYLSASQPNKKLKSNKKKS